MLNEISLFKDLSDDDIHILNQHATTKNYKKNTVIIKKGDKAMSLYILISGSVRIFTIDNEGKELVLDFLDEPGTWFGELALVGETMRTASVTTDQESVLMTISKEDFLQCLQNHPNIALALIRHLVNKIKVLTERVSTMALNDVYGRVITVLYSLAREEGGDLITRVITHQDIAHMVGATREAVTKILNELKKGEYIDIKNKRIILIKKLPAHW